MALATPTGKGGAGAGYFKTFTPFRLPPPPSHFQLFLLLGFDSLSFLSFSTKTSFPLFSIRSVCHARVARRRYESQLVPLNFELQNEAHTVSVLSPYSLSSHIISAFKHNGV